MFKNVLKRIQNESRSVQLVARNHECLKALNNVLCVFVHQDARYERNHELHSRLIIRATSCTLPGVR